MNNKNKPKKHWSPEEKQYVLNNIGRISIPEMAKHLNRSEMSVHLFIHRRRKSPKSVVKDNLLLRLLTLKFINPEYFEPNREFFQTVKIGQKRWWMLYKGIEQITEEEYKRVADHLEISLIDSFQSRQLTITF